jgi:hypothetical protein
MNPAINLKKEDLEDDSKKQRSLELYRSINEIIDLEAVYNVLIKTSVIRDYFCEKSSHSENPYDEYFNEGVASILNDVTEVLAEIKNNVSDLHPGIGYK